MRRFQVPRPRLLSVIALVTLVPLLVVLQPQLFGLHWTYAAEVNAFLSQYEAVCEKETSTSQMSLCPCLPKQPVGRFNASRWYQQVLGQALSTGSQAVHLPAPEAVNMGGTWRPRDCHARQRVAIIIPFRNRHQHLSVFVQYMHSFLQRQHLDYTIFVIEQQSPNIFNRASLLNVGFLEANKVDGRGFDCYIFHDVDLLPEDDRNMYTCFFSPLHLGAYMSKFHYQMPYDKFFGGAVSMKKAHVEAINGFPNKYFGWGGEDDDTRNRVLWQNLTIQRYPSVVGQSFMFKHDSDTDNPVNPLRDIGYDVQVDEYRRLGLSSVKYTQEAVRKADLYTMVTVNISQEYLHQCIVDHSLPATAPNNYVNCLTKANFKAATLLCCRRQDSVYCCASPSPMLPIAVGLSLSATVLLVCIGYLRHRRTRKF